MATTRDTYGATLSYGSPPVTVSHIEEITPPPETMGTYEVDYHDVENTEVHPTRVKPGAVTVRCGFDASDSGQMGLRDLMLAKTLTAFSIGLPDYTPAQTVSFNGYVTGWTPEALPANPKEQVLVVTIQPQVTVTYSPGAGA